MYKINLCNLEKNVHSVSLKVNVSIAFFLFLDLMQMAYIIGYIVLW